MRVAEIVKTMRESRGLSQAKLAELAGVHPNTIRNIEAGQLGTTTDILLSIARACEYDVVFNPRYKRGYS